MKEIVLEIAGLGDTTAPEPPQTRASEEPRAVVRGKAHAGALAWLGRGLTPALRVPASIFHRYRRWRLARDTVRELSALEDRLLTDIGLTRADIPIVAFQLAERDADESTRPTVPDARVHHDDEEQPSGRLSGARPVGQQWRRAA